MEGYVYVRSFETMPELEDYIKTVNVGVKDRSTFKSGLRIRYRCKERRKFPECGIQFAAKVHAKTSIITLYRKGEHKHDRRLKTSRPPSPVRERVKMYLSLGLTPKQVKRALETQGVDLPSPRKFRSLIAYYKSKRSAACGSAFITKRREERDDGNEPKARAKQGSSLRKNSAPTSSSESAFDEAPSSPDETTPISFVLPSAHPQTPPLSEGSSPRTLHNNNSSSNNVSNETSLMSSWKSSPAGPSGSAPCALSFPLLSSDH
uniref:FLYWCH-type domain-containing protein n=1 Tax=Trichuris muris TaxID=70415 RepID=A0A5S6QNZ1_TRIMR